jgi:hypothetical protein
MNVAQSAVVRQADERESGINWVCWLGGANELELDVIAAVFERCCWACMCVCMFERFH